MTHYPDLGPCDYFGAVLDLVAVGWLEPPHPFRQGPTSDAFREKLAQLMKSSWQPVLFFGPYFCQLCSTRRAAHSQNLFVPTHGRTYVAPMLITHYIETHAYCPPGEFVEAVQACPEMGSPEYFALLGLNRSLTEILSQSRSE